MNKYGIPNNFTNERPCKTVYKRGRGYMALAEACQKPQVFHDLLIQVMNNG